VIARVGEYVRRRAVWRTVEAMTGAALIGLGLKLASDPR